MYLFPRVGFEAYDHREFGFIYFLQVMMGDRIMGKALSALCDGKFAREEIPDLRILESKVYVL